MEQGMLQLHSILRWVILVLLLVAVAASINAKRKPFLPGHRKLGLAVLITADLLLVVGIYQWFMGSMGLKSIQANGMSVVMKNSVLRFFAIEHFIGMLLAIVLIHIGYSYARRELPDSVKHKRTLIFYLIALLLILAFVPWPFREVGTGRGWV
jgi:hypothetical protein